MFETRKQKDRGQPEQSDKQEAHEEFSAFLDGDAQEIIASVQRQGVGQQVQQNRSKKRAGDDRNHSEHQSGKEIENKIPEGKVQEGKAQRRNEHGVCRSVYTVFAQHHAAVEQLLADSRYDGAGQKNACGRKLLAAGGKNLVKAGGRADIVENYDLAVFCQQYAADQKQCGYYNEHEMIRLYQVEKRLCLKPAPFKQVIENAGQYENDKLYDRYRKKYVAF